MFSDSTNQTCFVRKYKEMRAFIAGIIDKNQLDFTVRLRDSLALSAVRSRPTARENLHITLEFLGDITRQEAEKAGKVLEDLDFTSVPFTIDKAGSFRSREGLTVWAGPGRAPELMGLQRRLHRALLQEGFKLEERRFVPHITLLRKAIAPVLPEAFDPIPGRISTITLFESELRREGPLYTALVSVTGRH